MVIVIPTRWDPKTRICSYEKQFPSRKCRFKHISESVSSVENEVEDNAPDVNDHGEIAWMFTARTKPEKNIVNNEVYKTLTARRADKTFCNDWVIDGGASINLSNDIAGVSIFLLPVKSVFL